MRRNALKELFERKQTALGGWCAIGNPYSAEVLGHCGYDTVVVDLQHGLIFLDQAMGMLAAISATPAMPMARVSENHFFEINKLLDAGAYGVICPMIDDVEDARRFVSACRYPPAGTRSYGPARGLLYGGMDYFAGANNEILTLAMIETPRTGMPNFSSNASASSADSGAVPEVTARMLARSSRRSVECSTIRNAAAPAKPLAGGACARRRPTCRGRIGRATQKALPR